MQQYTGRGQTSAVPCRVVTPELIRFRRAGAVAGETDMSGPRGPQPSSSKACMEDGDVRRCSRARGAELVDGERGREHREFHCFQSGGPGCQ